MNYTPFVMGSGRAARAMREAMRVVEIAVPEISFLPLRQLARGESPKGITAGAENPILFIANPHGLHAPSILEADSEGYQLIVVEKPAAVSLDEVRALSRIKTPVAVCHGYRQMWGVQTLRRQVEAGEFGQIIAVEGRYWQSSSAQSSMAETKSPSWKNDPRLGGTSDTLIDIASHWADAAFFVLGERPVGSDVSLSYINADAPHRDTHVHMNFRFPSGARAMASVSKTVHGATNGFEIHVIGQKKYAKWNFLNPDEIEVGVGANRALLARAPSESTASGHAPFHGLGWLEGYVEIFRRALTGKGAYPTLPEHLKVLESLLVCVSSAR